MKNIKAYSINCMAVTSSEHLLVLRKLNPEKNGDLKCLKPFGRWVYLKD